MGFMQELIGGFVVPNYAGIINEEKRVFSSLDSLKKTKSASPTQAQEVGRKVSLYLRMVFRFLAKTNNIPSNELFMVFRSISLLKGKIRDNIIVHNYIDLRFLRGIDMLFRKISIQTGLKKLMPATIGL